MDAVADGAVLCGSIDELAQWLDVSAGALRAALQELAAVRWIVTEVRPDGRLTVRWERRQHAVPVAVDRRRGPDDGARRRLTR